MTQVIDAMNGTWGRLGRAALGLALITYGLAILGDSAGYVLAALGLVPLGLGIWGRCVLELVARPRPAPQDVASTTAVRHV